MTKSKLKTREKAEKIIVNTIKITGSTAFLVIWSYVVYHVIKELIKFTF